MGRILTVVMGLAIVGYLGYRQMHGNGPVGNSTPKERLDNVKAAATRIEQNEAKATEEALKKANPDGP